MATIKISELDSIKTLSNSDILPIVNEGETKKMTVDKLGDIFATKDYVYNATDRKIIKKTIIWGTDEFGVGEYPNDALAEMGEIITQSYNDNMYLPMSTCHISIRTNTNLGHTTELEPFVIRIKQPDYYFNEYGGTYDRYPNQYRMVVTGEWGGSGSNVFTCTSVRREIHLDYLSTTGQTGAYVPTENYHPATKKYVDDSIKTAITDALGGEY